MLKQFDMLAMLRLNVNIFGRISFMTRFRFDAFEEGVTISLKKKL